MDWNSLYDEVRTCTRCPLCETRTNVVFGEGPQDASILFIGEGPGAQEDLTGRPFIGRSGNLLTELMDEAGLPRDRVFITNMVKCRPPENRNPSKQEVSSCRAWLDALVNIMRPEVVVTVGNVPTQSLLDTKKGITSLRGSFHRVQLSGREIPLLPVFHPAYLLRYRSREKGKPISLTIEDFRSLRPWL